MLNYPLLHFNGEPEGVNAKSNDGEKEPLDVVSEKLSTVSVKGELLAVNNSVLSVPSFLKADSPRRSDAESESNDECLKNAYSYHSKQTAGKFRFHDVFLQSYFGRALPAWYNYNTARLESQVSSPKKI
jgi:hypothetical protein